ncbi:MAG TPA: DUF3826 domain-containing protein [Flavisolibacter sp.]|nr:DUF3826 domain-containing protein [Flavisolibacter sp.]
MKNLLALFFFSFMLLANESYGQSSEKAVSQEKDYATIANERAKKIVTTLAIQDAAKAQRVQALIAGHYQNLNTIHSTRDSQLKLVKSAIEEKEKLNASIKGIEDAAGVEVKGVHQSFISSLSKELTEEQIVKVKDGLTYNVVNITYAGYLDMLPNLTTEQKTQIRTWLEEAREYAMDAESSDKKHAWFGKYKGRINNYLSAAGYDLKKEGDAWQQRIKEREEKKKASNN